MTARRALMAAFKVGIPIIAGFVVVVLLIPAGGVDSDIPRCQSVLGYRVPCDVWLSLVAGAAMSGVVGLALWLNGRRKR